MWYVRDLMLMVLFSPFFYYVLKKIGIGFVALMGILWYFTKVGLFPDFGFDFFTAFFFFSWGGFFRIKKVDLIFELRRFKLATLFWILTIVVDLICNNGYVHYLCIILGIYSIVQITSNLLESKRITTNNTFLADCSFFVFASHILIMKRMATTIFYILKIPNNDWILLFTYFIVPFLTIVLCMLLYSLLRKKMPFFCGLLTGGR